MYVKLLKNNTKAFWQNIFPVVRFTSHLDLKLWCLKCNIKWLRTITEENKIKIQTCTPRSTFQFKKKRIKDFMKRLLFLQCICIYQKQSFVNQLHWKTFTQIKWYHSFFSNRWNRFKHLYIQTDTSLSNYWFKHRFSFQTNYNQRKPRIIPMWIKQQDSGL